MSMQEPNQEPKPIQKIIAREAILGEGLAIRRALPTKERRMVGAWCFMDHLGPVGPEHSLSVGAHPHTCLQTFTWMIKGEVLHRDSLGFEQVIRPGQVNLMTAGRGISHTEDSVPSSDGMHTVQLWIALPPEHAQIEPAFDHYPDLPKWSQGSAQLTLLVGDLATYQAPTRVYSPLMAVDILSSQEEQVKLDLKPEFEYGVLVLYGEVSVQGQEFNANEFAYFAPGQEQIEMAFAANTRVVFIGGEPAPAVTMWWNFVDYSKDAIVQSQAEWENHSARFGTVVEGEHRRLAAPTIPWK